MENAVTVLQNVIMNSGEKLLFKYTTELKYQCECRAFGDTVTASAYSREAAKEIAAQLMLQKIFSKEYPGPPQDRAPTFSTQDPVAGANLTTGFGAPISDPIPMQNYGMLLQEFCEPLLLSPVKYQLMQISGVRYMRHFTVRVSVGPYERYATATSEKNASQLAAKSLYHYLREIIPRTTTSAIISTANRASISVATSATISTATRATTSTVAAKKQVFLPAILETTQPQVKTRGYISRICSEIGEARCNAARCLLDRNVSTKEIEGVLLDVALILGIKVEYCDIECANGILCLVKLISTSLPLTFGEAAAGRAAASQKALNYIRTLLGHHLPPSATIISMNGSHYIPTLFAFK